MSTTSSNDLTVPDPHQQSSRQVPGGEGRPWSAGKVIALVVGLVGALVAMSLLILGIVGLAIDQSQRDSTGMVGTGPVKLESDGYAVSASGLEVDTAVPGWLQLRSVFGDIRITAADTAGRPIFIGIARAADAGGYLDDLSYDEVSRVSGGTVTYLPHLGGAPESAPSDQEFWVAWTQGPGEQTLTVELDTGSWVAVVMNADASPEVDVVASVAADLPALPW